MTIVKDENAVQDGHEPETRQQKSQEHGDHQQRSVEDLSDKSEDKHILEDLLEVGHLEMSGRTRERR